MSLAEDLRRAYEKPVDRSAPKSAALRAQSAPALRAVASPGNLAEVRKSEPVRDPGRAPDASLDILEQASRGVVLILERYKQLEDHVRQLDTWSKAQIQAAETASQQWQQAAAASDQKLKDLEKAVDAMTRRAEAAEANLKRDTDALNFIQDRIVAAFGFGSEAHDAIKAMGFV